MSTTCFIFLFYLVSLGDANSPPPNSNNSTTLECAWEGHDTPYHCDENTNCCPFNAESPKWGCCPEATYCKIIGSGVGSCCTIANETCTDVTKKAFEKPLKYSNSDLLLAFLLTTGAGLATALGTLPVLCVSEGDSTSILGYSLAFAAGVMIYISFVEILAEAIVLFQHSNEAGPARFFAFLTFFSGILFGYLIDLIVHECLERDAHGTHDFEETNKENSNIELGVQSNIMLGKEEGNAKESRDNEDNTSPKEELQSNPELLRVSLITAVAIAAHNLPEGLVTFITALHDPKLGGAVACAIAIHNIPEGISIAMPLYYHNGSFCKAFLWCLASGVTEPIGALIGYGILDSMFGSEVFGTLFGVVGGIMVYISFAELLPTAAKTDAKYVNVAVFVGMFVMEISLIFFEL